MKGRCGREAEVVWSSVNLIRVHEESAGRWPHAFIDGKLCTTPGNTRALFRVGPVWGVNVELLIFPVPLIASRLPSVPAITSRPETFGDLLTSSTLSYLSVCYHHRLELHAVRDVDAINS